MLELDLANLRGNARSLEIWTSLTLVTGEKDAPKVWMICSELSMLQGGSKASSRGCFGFPLIALQSLPTFVGSTICVFSFLATRSSEQTSSES